MVPSRCGFALDHRLQRRDVCEIGPNIIQNDFGLVAIASQTKHLRPLAWAQLVLLVKSCCRTSSLRAGNRVFAGSSRPSGDKFRYSSRWRFAAARDRFEELDFLGGHRQCIHRLQNRLPPIPGVTGKPRPKTPSIASTMVARLVLAFATAVIRRLPQH
jgi:hypothetical protein